MDLCTLIVSYVNWTLFAYNMRRVRVCETQRSLCQYPHLFVGFQHNAVYFSFCVPGYLKHLNFLVTLDVIKAWLI